MIEYIPALMRTLVPAIYGWLILHFAVVKFIPAGIAQPLVAAAILGVVYLVLRLLEKLKPEIGILLGWIGAPSYVSTAVDSTLDNAVRQLQPSITTLGSLDLSDLRAAAMKELVHLDPKLLLQVLDAVEKAPASAPVPAAAVAAPPASAVAAPAVAAPAQDAPGQIDAVVDAADPILTPAVIAPQVPTGADGRPAAPAPQV